MAEDRLPSEPEEFPEPPYRDIRRWCIQAARPLAPADLMRKFRLGWNRANALLEELEADGVLRSFSEGGRRLWVAGEVPAAPDRPAPSALRAPRRYRRGTQFERCAVCDWFIPEALGATETRGVHRHHIVPLSCGGPDEPSNLIELCPSHHALVHILWTRTGGRYAGPKTHAALIEAVRFAEADPEEFARRRRLEASFSLDLWRPHPTPPPPTTHQTPRLRANAIAVLQGIALRKVTHAMTRRHLREQHGGPIATCWRCGMEDEPTRLDHHPDAPTAGEKHRRD